MKFKGLFSLLCTLSLLAGCSFDSSSPTVWPGNDVIQGSKMVPPNSDIIAELIILNKNEIAAAELAQTQATNPEVKQYAAYLYTEHSNSLSNYLALSQKTGIAPHMNPKAIHMQRDGSDTLAHLKTLQGSKFNKAYIQTMIKGHQKASGLINQSIKLSTNADLTNVLKETKHHVEIHLQKAERILKQLH
jgi:putative membrane protein